MGDDAFDEFSFLPEQAADIGATTPLPPVRRLAVGLPDGRTLSALRFGDAPPQVTLLHGAGLNARTWDTTVLALGLPALAIDLPGHGDSSWREDADYSPHTLAPDIVRALEEWTEGPQVLVGHSLGGLAAAAVAAAAPALVARLVIVDITPGVDPAAGPQQIRSFFAGPTDWASRDELVERALSFGLGGTRRAAERGVFLNSRVRPDGRVEWKHHFARLAAAQANGELPEGRNDALAALLSDAGWSDLRSLALPITLVRGDSGYVTPADLAEFSRRLPAASIVTLPAHHNVHEEIPVAFADALRRIAAG
ncbi:alpha/beta fold hydrolase [Microbacterium sp. SORGH_AS_0888]|uniref:alpha/beta fold hydrolase n=1 Tax=Microbacterium sp. SORGH_AS_0888 TaxID=3041791 RepID=UPI00277FA75A|nr:alpha/beta hydrolase [Microbacterium sp. SORGH_AS_0888]MDQ1127967.1 pimeloyl-ACP methyl ester carboxylesterase [Microbacterium sp. SORGH_AS_0888]